VDKTDLLIGIGTRLDVPIARWAPAPSGLKVARIDIDPAEHRRLPVDVAIVADAADATRALTTAAARNDDPARRKVVATAKGHGACGDPESPAAIRARRSHPRRAAR